MSIYQKDKQSSASPHAASNLSTALRVPTYIIKFVLIKIRVDFESSSRTVREYRHSYSSSQLLLLPKRVNVFKRSHISWFILDMIVCKF